MTNWNVEDREFWVSGNLEANGEQYIYEIMLTKVPSKLGVFSGRVIFLNLFDSQDQLIAEYDKKWIIAPEKGTVAYKLVSQILKENNFRRKEKRSA